MATNYLQGVNVGNGVADAYFRAGQVAKDVGSSFRDKELVDYKMQLAAQEREDRLKQQAIDNKRAEAMLGMAQNQEQRAIDALAKTDRTQVATAEYNDRLAKVASGEQLDEQANENIRKAFATGGEKAVLSTLAKEQDAIKADPNRLKAMLGTTTYGDASTYDPITGQLVGGGTVDTTGMINLQNKVLEGQQGQIDILNKQKFEANENAKKIKADKDNVAQTFANNKSLKKFERGLMAEQADDMINAYLGTGAIDEAQAEKLKLLKTPEAKASVLTGMVQKKKTTDAAALSYDPADELIKKIKATGQEVDQRDVSSALLALSDPDVRAKFSLLPTVAEKNKLVNNLVPAIVRNKSQWNRAGTWSAFSKEDFADYLKGTTKSLY